VNEVPPYVLDMGGGTAIAASACTAGTAGEGG